jgi:glyoxalase/bleomycin resistance protein/dioxygenase superfamily protein
VALTHIDHVTIEVRDVRAGADAWRRLGFDLHLVGDKAIARNDDDYLELAGGAAEGIRAVALRSSALAADRAALAARGAPPHVVLTDSLQPRGLVPAMHPNRVFKLERVYVAVADVARAAREWRRILELPEPRIERGTVIMADMAVFQFEGAGLVLAQPYAAGVCADALAQRGEGPFQVLYRTKSMDAAAKWMADHRVPPPARGTRNTGEQAMLVAPGHAHGVYVGFVGKA